MLERIKNTCSYLYRFLVRQFCWKQCWRFVKLFFACIGTFYAFIKLLDLIATSHQEWKGFVAFKDHVEGDWLIFIIIGILLISLVMVFKRIKVKYTINNKEVDIVFDYCSVISGSGQRVIEISNTLCLDNNKIGITNDLTWFKAKFKKTSSLNLGDNLKAAIKELGFKPESSGKGKKAVYPLGVLSNIEFCGDKYIFAISIKRDNNEQNITTDDDFTKFLSEFWVNIAKQDWKDDVLRIPVFSGAGGYTWETKMKIYWIVYTFIANVKSGIIPCKELHICINNDKEYSKDLDSFKSLSKYIDDFAIASVSGGKRIGEVLDIVSTTMESA